MDEKVYVWSKSEDGSSVQTIDVDSLIGCTFLLPPDQDGNVHRATIMEAVEDNKIEASADPTLQKFRCDIGDGKFEEIHTYNKILNYLEKDGGMDGQWKFKAILDHAGPFAKGSKDPRYQGERFSLKMDWENGEQTWVARSNVDADNKPLVALYAKDNHLLDTPGWKTYKNLARREKKMLRLVNQAKLCSYRTAPRYKVWI